MRDDDLRYRKRILRRSHVLKTHRTIPNESFECYTQQQRMISGRKKLDGLMCSICEGPAHGYNFDVITCESCKAFFRRNALKNTETFKCRISDGKCVIKVSTRKRCKACRLAKCFEKGMRADWILTDEERSIKRQKIEDNRRLREMIYPTSCESTSDNIYPLTKAEPLDLDEDANLSLPLDNSTTSSPRSLLESNDLGKIHQIQQAFADSVRLTSLPNEVPSYPQAVELTHPIEMINFPANTHATRLIKYFKLLPDFSQLNEDDKIILIKYNTFALVIMRSSLCYDQSTDTYHEPNTDECIFSGQDLIKCFSYHQYEQSTRCVRNLVYASMNDRLVLQIFLIIMLFSKGSALSTDSEENEPIANNILSIYQAQNIFIDLLWKYCENKYGYKNTVRLYLRLTASSIDTHYQAFATRRDYVKVDDVAQQLVPLMKSVMLIV